MVEKHALGGKGSVSSDFHRGGHMSAVTKKPGYAKRMTRVLLVHGSPSIHHVCQAEKKNSPS